MKDRLNIGQMLIKKLKLHMKVYKRDSALIKTTNYCIYVLQTSLKAMVLQALEFAFSAPF